mgnify:CR=1 FL=1
MGSIWERVVSFSNDTNRPFSLCFHIFTVCFGLLPARRHYLTHHFLLNMACRGLMQRFRCYEATLLGVSTRCR